MSTTTNVYVKKSGRYGHFCGEKYVRSRANEFIQCFLYNYEICPVQITTVICNCHTACGRDSHAKETYIWASPQENLSLGLVTRPCSNQPAQLQRLARIMRLRMKQV